MSINIYLDVYGGLDIVHFCGLNLGRALENDDDDLNILHMVLKRVEM